MFPKLSERAWDQIRRISFYDPTVDERKLPVGDFMALFDRKEYPVTREMLFDFLSNGNRFHDERLRRWGEASTPDIFSFKDDITKKFIAYYKDVDDINYVIDKMCREVLQCDIILFIGHIHGWFEKGDKP